jgi:hypothetical protein
MRVSEGELAKLSRGAGCLCATFLVLAGSIACSSGSESAGGGAGGGESTLATVEVLADAVTIRRGGTSEPAESGASVAQGDQVSTDATGFAEVVFFDGSWQRIDHDTTLTLTELVDIEGGRRVRTGIDAGRAWQRVEALTSDDDAVELDAPVAVAAVRGTSYSADCTIEPVGCTFAVVEGSVALSFSDGAEVTLSGGERLTARRDEPVGPVEAVGVAVLQQDPWIAENLALDATDPPTPPSGDESGPGAPPPDVELAAAANAVCVAAGEQNESIALGGGDTDEVARRQADVLDDALGQLADLEPSPEADEQFRGMIADYRRRTTLVREALVAPADQRPTLVSQLLVATADGAAKARALGMADCVIRPR